MSQHSRGELDYSTLPEWLREHLETESALAEPVHVPVPEDGRGTSAWKLMLDAAVVSAFSPEELAPRTRRDRSQAERFVLSFSRIVPDPDRSSWTLTSNARARTINASSAAERKAALARTGKRFTDPLSSALRSCIAGKMSASLEKLDSESLDALRKAVALLEETRGLNLPSIDDLEREIQLRRLLAGFERMTGRRAVTGSERSDRFFGREDDLKALRTHVDVLAAGSLGEQVTRLLGRARRRIHGSPPLVISGSGGIGKTTLMSKFMLEHARAARMRYPFTYLDFDRSTVSARDPFGLLIEMCRQVGAQFGQLTPALERLSVELGQVSRRAGDNARYALSALPPFQQEFRRIVETFLDEAEDDQGPRPFLLVFDTFEVVQYSLSDVEALDYFVRSFAEDSTVWLRLRLVIAGRNPVPKFLGKPQGRPLGPLEHPAAAEMLETHAADAGLILKPEDTSRLVRAIAKAGGTPKLGVHPLRLRLVGEVLLTMRDEDQGTSRATGKALVSALIEDLENPRATGGIKAALLDGFLIRRVLGHIADRRVRALADPGLVVRIITPDVIRNVLAPAGPPPQDEPDRSDNMDFEPWQVDEHAAVDICEAFGREGTLVEEDGQALRYRQDVRSEMVKVIRDGRPRRFKHIHELAWKYFSERATGPSPDEAAAAEAIYHGLMLEFPAAEVDRFWLGSGFAPRIDVEEFAEDSEASIYLRSRVSHRLTAAEVARLDSRLALAWVVRHHEAMLQDTEINDTIASARAAAGEDFAKLLPEREAAATMARLLFKGGEWAQAASLSDRLMNEQIMLTHTMVWLSAFRTRLSVEVKSGLATPLSHGLSDWSSAIDVKDPLARVEVLAHAMLGNAPIPGLADQLSAAIGGIEVRHWLKEARILRLAILAGGPRHRRLILTYLETIDHFPRDLSITPFVRQLFGTAYERNITEATQDSYRQLLGTTDGTKVLEAADALYRRDKRPVIEALMQRDDLLHAAGWIVIAEHRDWINPLAGSLERYLRVSPGAAKRLADLAPASRGALRTALSADVTALTLVVAASDDGLLIPFAQAITQLESRGVQTSEGYPSAGPGIAHALIGWDNRLKERYRTDLEQPPAV